MISLTLLEHAMASLYGATEVMLHVRKSNRAAISLYRDSLGFEVTGVEKGYCEFLLLGSRDRSWLHD